MRKLMSCSKTHKVMPGIFTLPECPTFCTTCEDIDLDGTVDCLQCAESYYKTKELTCAREYKLWSLIYNTMSRCSVVIARAHC